MLGVRHAMRRYRVWAKNPSLREMARLCGQKVSPSTFRNMQVTEQQVRVNMVGFMGDCFVAR